MTEIGNPFEGHSDRVFWVSFSSDGHRIVSGGDNTVRMWNIATREQIGDPLIGHTTTVTSVAESSDGRFVVSRDWFATFVWDRESRVIVWRSDDANSTLTKDEAESVIRSCGHETPHLWPSCFPEYSAEIYCDRYAVYSNVAGERMSVGNLRLLFGIGSTMV